MFILRHQDRNDVVTVEGAVKIINFGVDEPFWIIHRTWYHKFRQLTKLMFVKKALLDDVNSGLARKYYS